MAALLLTKAQAAEMLAISPRTLERYDRNGEGPGFVRVGPKMKRYDREACRAWAAARTYPHQAAETARRLKAQRPATS